LRSLFKNLKTDYIDLPDSLAFWCFNSKIVPIEETMSALIELKQQGKIQVVFLIFPAQLEEIARTHDSLQPPYSLFWRQVEADAMPYCIKTIFQSCLTL